MATFIKKYKFKKLQLYSYTHTCKNKETLLYSGDDEGTTKCTGICRCSFNEEFGDFEICSMTFSNVSGVTIGISKKPAAISSCTNHSA